MFFSLCLSLSPSSLLSQRRGFWTAHNNYKLPILRPSLASSQVRTRESTDPDLITPYFPELPCPGSLVQERQWSVLRYILQHRGQARSPALNRDTGAPSASPLLSTTSPVEPAPSLSPRPRMCTSRTSRPQQHARTVLVRVQSVHSLNQLSQPADMPLVGMGSRRCTPR